MDSISFEDKHPRRTDGKFTAKTGSEADVTLGGVGSDASVYDGPAFSGFEDAMADITKRFEDERDEARRTLLEPALAEAVRRRFPEATAVDYKRYGTTYYGEEGFYSLEKIWQGDTVLFDGTVGYPNRSWTPDESSGHALQDELRALWQWLPTDGPDEEYRADF